MSYETKDDFDIDDPKYMKIALMSKDVFNGHYEYIHGIIGKIEYC